MRLIARLLELQHEHGCLTDDLLGQLARAANVPLYRLQGLVSFYPHFRTMPPAKTEIAVCRDMACWLADPDAPRRVADHFQENSDVQVREVSCLGRCDLAPAALVNDIPKSCAAACDLIGDLKSPVTPQAAKAWRCDPYQAESERFGLFKELLQHPRDEAAQRVLATLKAAGLRGMGGAGFPTAAKWELVRAEARTPKYVICNADESEPGTFKDREILAQLSHVVLEGMFLAGLVAGAEQGILFIRHEYAAEREAFEKCLNEARQLGLLGDNIFGSGVRFDLEIFVSPGGYILGEETALLECLEDKRGEPRNKPPFPGTHGLHGQPTLINNVETLALVPGIVRNGAPWWQAQGRPGFAGLKFMAVSGHVAKPGVYEIPVGMPVRELIELAGGMKDGRPLLAFLPGGASSNFLPAALADTPLDFAAMTKAGSMLGSGALFVVAEGTDLLALAANVVRFFRNESCGKCVPCRVGSQKAVDLLENVQGGQAAKTALSVLPELGETMALTSICGLGQVALNPVSSLMKMWGEFIRMDARHPVIKRLHEPLPAAKDLAETSAVRQPEITQATRYYIEAPSEYVGSEPSLFLAGGITGTVDWQAEIRRALADLPLVLLNPRRRHFPMDNPAAAQEQIEWEFRHLRRATGVLFWFPPETLCPIALYELGSRAAGKQPLFVGTHPQYQRRIDIQIQLRLARPEVYVFSDLNELARQVKSWFQQFWRK